MSDNLDDLRRDEWLARGGHCGDCQRKKHWSVYSPPHELPECEECEHYKPNDPDS